MLTSLLGSPTKFADRLTGSFVTMHTGSERGFQAVSTTRESTHM